MVAFDCDRCGKCCVSLGSIIKIERQLNDRDYYCRYNIDNSLFLAHVDQVFCDEIADEFANISIPAGPEKKPCRFLRKNRQGDGTVCSIYSTRPYICRDFRCYHVLICNRDGKTCGSVRGKNTLHTEDAVLRNLWEEQVVAIAYGDTAVWKKKVADILAEHGYRAESVK
jgi:uncharacterized protein